jgi:hypothetical protein
VIAGYDPPPMASLPHPDARDVLLAVAPVVPFVPTAATGLLAGIAVAALGGMIGAARSTGAPARLVLAVAGLALASVLGVAFLDPATVRGGAWLALGAVVSALLAGFTRAGPAIGHGAHVVATHAAAGGRRERMKRDAATIAAFLLLAGALAHTARRRAAP